VRGDGRGETSRTSIFLKQPIELRAADRLAGTRIFHMPEQEAVAVLAMTRSVEVPANCDLAFGVDGDGVGLLALYGEFQHNDEKGFNVVLDALPLDGRLVLREISADEEEESDDDHKTKKRAARTKR